MGRPGESRPRSWARLTLSGPLLLFWPYGGRLLGFRVQGCCSHSGRLSAARRHERALLNLVRPLLLFWPNGGRIGISRSQKRHPGMPERPLACCCPGPTVTAALSGNLVERKRFKNVRCSSAVGRSGALRVA